MGLTRAQVRKLLPQWWDPAAEASADAVAELAMHLSRRLSLEVDALLAGRLQPKGAVSRLMYKHGSQVPESALTAASYIASSLAQAVVGSMSQAYVPLPAALPELQRDARELQQGMLGFEGLLALCWKHGIPVIPLPNLPVGVRKMDGAALSLGGRPVIVLAKKKSSRAWLSFILAHEMGHIARGHVRAGSSIVDVSLQESAEYATESSQDEVEREADAYALEVLGGLDGAAEVRRWPAHASPVDMAVLAREAAARLKVEAGHFVLRSAFNTRRWPEAMIALRFLSEDVNPEAALLGQLRKHLHIDRVAPDLQDLVVQVTGLDRAQEAQ